MAKPALLFDPSAGRPVSVTLTDPEVIQKLDTLATKLGGIKKAIEHALKTTKPAT